MGLADDPRAADGLDLLEQRQLPEGRWRAGGRWWKAPGSKSSNVEAVDWGLGPNELLTLHALRVLLPPAAAAPMADAECEGGGSRRVLIAWRCGRRRHRRLPRIVPAPPDA